MERRDDIEIAVFRAYGVQYRVSKFREKRCGKVLSGRTAYFLNKTLFPSHTRIRIRISADVIGELKSLSNAAGMALCEELIAEQLCQNCRRDKAREPPPPEPQESQDRTSNLL